MRLVLMSGLLCLPGLLPAQDEVPELDIWWEIRGGGDERSWLGSGFSYLPDFDTLNGGSGHNALAIISGFPQDDSLGGCETWYLNEKMSRKNHFYWPTGEVMDIAFGDFDGDGIRDYISWGGKVWQGRMNGLPPDSPYVADYRIMFEPSSRYFVVRDLNQDGFDDVLVRSGTIEFDVVRILMGGPDLTDLQVIQIKDQAADLRTEEFYIGLPQQLSTRGKQMMVTQIAHIADSMVITPVEVSFVLWELDFRPSGDSLVLERVKLDSISDAEMRPEAEFDYAGAATINSDLELSDYLLISVTEKDYIQYAEIVNDLFDQNYRFTTNVTPTYSILPLFGSIDGDRIPDWGFGTRFGRILLSGPVKKGVPPTIIGKVNYECAGFVTGRYIGDITGDGIGDFATSQYESASCFRIYAGVDRGTPVSAVEQRVRLAELGQHYPNPAPRSGYVTIPVYVKHPGRYELELYNLRGIAIAQISSGYLPAGEHELEFNTQAYELTAGFYLLRLRGGPPGKESVHERGLLVS